MNKITNVVNFPIDQFDISDYVTDSVKKLGKSIEYKLCAVSNHQGTLDEGHYTAFCRYYNTNKCVKVQLQKCTDNNMYHIFTFFQLV